MGCDSFMLSTKTQNSIDELKNLEHLFDFSNLDENHEIFSIENKKIVGKCKITNSKNIWIYEFIVLRIEAYSFTCNDKITNKLKGISNSQSKSFNFEEYKK